MIDLRSNIGAFFEDLTNRDLRKMAFVDTSELKFFESKEGLIVIYKGKKIILGPTSISEVDANFSKKNFTDYAKIVKDLYCALNDKPIHTSNINEPVCPKLENDFTPFVKYVEESTFQNYIKNGYWQLGTIEQYRTIENITQRDEFEGYSFVNFRINNSTISSVVNTGFNYLIFCATKNQDSTALKEQFGSKQLYFPNVRSFADRIAKTINAKRYQVQNVEYNSLKLYINNNAINNSKIPTNSAEHILTPELFKVIQHHATYPSLFVKPEVFQQENEVRIIFEMPKDQYKPYRFKSKELLSYIRY
jgi:hypothetical protein